VNEEQGHMIFFRDKTMKTFLFVFLGKLEEFFLLLLRKREGGARVWLSPVKDPFGELVWQT